jgi:glycosyltransferase involved in cell wall biosynthesis
VYHSAVVAPWRSRDRWLRELGVDLALVSADRWDEGGRTVTLDAGGDRFVVVARTWGRHPNVFIYDPRPLWRLLRRWPVDVLDVHEEPCSLAVAELRLLRRLLTPSAKLLLYSAENIPKRYPWPFRRLERTALRQASGVYVCNQAAGRIARVKGFTGALDVLPLGVDVERFAPNGSAPDDGVTRGRLRLGYVGRLDHRKGVHVVLEAMRDEPGWTLDVVGDGEDAAMLTELVRRWGLEERVRFTGFYDNVDLPERYRSFDVVVVPSLPTPRWEEQFCRVAVEAMASGVPVVASASGALPEVVGEGGVLVSPGDVNEWHDALASLAADRPRMDALGQQARGWSQRFRWQTVAEGHLALYHRVMA